LVFCDAVAAAHLEGRLRSSGFRDHSRWRPVHVKLCIEAPLRARLPLVTVLPLVSLLLLLLLLPWGCDANQRRGHRFIVSVIVASV
jgi:hypothetical protein